MTTGYTCRTWLYHLQLSLQSQKFVSLQLLWNLKQLILGSFAIHVIQKPGSKFESIITFCLCLQRALFLYVGNLSLKVTKEDLARHFGLDTTPYIRSSSWIELAVERTGTSQGFGFINVPERLASKSLVVIGTLWSSTVTSGGLKNKQHTLCLYSFFCSIHT